MSHSDLIEAIKMGNFANVQKAVEDGADVNEVVPHMRLASQSYTSLTPLFLAIDNGHTNIAQYLIDKGAAPMAIVNDWSTPFHEAVMRGYSALVASMAAKGADVNMLATKSQTRAALHIAVSSGDPETMQVLLEYGASPNVGESVLACVQVNARDLAAPLIDAGADIMGLDDKGKHHLDSFRHSLQALCEKHLINLENRMNYKPGDGMPLRELVVAGKPTTLLNHILGAGKLPELFAASRWQGREAAAVRLHDEIAGALPPYYRPAFAMIDMAALREQALSNSDEPTTLARYKRNTGKSGPNR